MSTESETRQDGRSGSAPVGSETPTLDELAARVTATAARLSGTVAELKVELQPAQIAQRATAKTKASISEALRDESGAIKPVVLIVGAAGIALVGFAVVWKIVRRR